MVLEGQDERMAGPKTEALTVLGNGQWVSPQRPAAQPCGSDRRAMGSAADGRQWDRLRLGLGRARHVGRCWAGGAGLCQADAAGAGEGLDIRPPERLGPAEDQRQLRRRRWTARLTAATRLRPGSRSATNPGRRESCLVGEGERGRGGICTTHAAVNVASTIQTGAEQQRLSRLAGLEEMRRYGVELVVVGSLDLWVFGWFRGTFGSATNNQMLR
jgi:hypothetical protein